MKKITYLILLSLLFCLTGCEGPAPIDYRAYVKHMPRSILVLPPVNESAQVKASDAFLSTVTRLIAEKGYYVFPVALVDQHMKENGVTVPGEMHAINPRKFKEIYGADAVLYIDIKEWTTTYIVIDSTTTVTLTYRLTDTATGTDIWKQSSTYSYSSSQGQSDAVGMLVAASIRAIASSMADLETDIARNANTIAFNNVQSGLLLGTKHPKYETLKPDVQAKIKAYEDWEKKHGNKHIAK